MAKCLSANHRCRIKKGHTRNWATRPVSFSYNTPKKLPYNKPDINEEQRRHGHNAITFKLLK